MEFAMVLGSVFVLHVVAMVSPGPNFLIVTHTAIRGTRRAGVSVALGVAAGAAIWSSVAVVGLNIVFVHHAWLYRGIKLLGGLYLIHLGVDSWRKADQRAGQPEQEDGKVASNWQAFRLGLLTNLLNPKAAVFFASIFAALVAPDLDAWVRLAAVGMIVTNAVGWHVALAYFFSTQRAQQSYRRLKHWINRVTGTALALFGLRLLWTSR